MLRIKTIQTRDCYYPIYEERETSVFYNPDEFQAGFYFYDEEMESKYLGDPSAYFGPYKTLDDVCKAQHRHYVSIMSL